MIDEMLLIDELKFRVRTPRSTMEIIRDIIPLVEMQPQIEYLCRELVIDEFCGKLSERLTEASYNATVDGVENVDILTLDMAIDEIGDVSDELKRWKKERDTDCTSS